MTVHLSEGINRCLGAESENRQSRLSNARSVLAKWKQEGLESGKWNKEYRRERKQYVQQPRRTRTNSRNYMQFPTEGLQGSGSMLVRVPQRNSAVGVCVHEKKAGWGVFSPGGDWEVQQPAIWALETQEATGCRSSLSPGPQGCQWIKSPSQGRRSVLRLKQSGRQSPSSGFFAHIRPSADWMMPAYPGESNLLHSVHWFKYDAETSSETLLEVVFNQIARRPMT